ncbi:MAG: SCO family protein [Bryobacter sp.]|nr:SCO family protein [Bryobacter sp.]
MRRRSLLPLALLGACAKPGPDLPDYGGIPPFEFTGMDAKPFASSQLEGKVWVVDFFFTHCPGPCPRMSKQLRELQEQTSGLQDFRIVSITVDPARDTPEALAAYARRYQADPARWHFLTGRKDLIGNLMSEAFFLGFADSLEEHSTKFALVDRRMRLRGYYDSYDAPGHAGENIAALLASIKELHGRS